MGYRPGEPIKLPDGYHVEPATVSVGHQAIQFRPLLPGAGDAGVDVLAGNGPAACSVYAQQRMSVNP